MCVCTCTYRYYIYLSFKRSIKPIDDIMLLHVTSMFDAL